MNKYVFVIVAWLFNTAFIFLNSADITIVGVAHAARSIGQHTKSFIDCLKDQVSIQLITSGWSNTRFLPSYLRAMIVDKKHLKSIDSPVLIYTDLLTEKNLNFIRLHKHQGIRLVFAWTDYDVVDSVEIDRINSFFDAVIVPDEYLVDVYIASGVRIPIFVLPESVCMDNFLSFKKNFQNKPFVFGCSALLEERKNLGLLIDAFYEEFKDSKDVILRLHGRWGEDYQFLRQKIKALKAQNITLQKKIFTPDEYRSFMCSLDCFVLISKAEAFSITPREALAAGIPCILSNNTAHKTLCETGFYVPVISRKECPDASGMQKKQFIFNCAKNDVKAVLRDVYCNYSKYLERAQRGREWVIQYSPSSLQDHYVSLVKPKNVVLGEKNILSPYGIETNSRLLFEKYQKLVSKK